MGRASWMLLCCSIMECLTAAGHKWVGVLVLGVVWVPFFLICSKMVV